LRWLRRAESIAAFARKNETLYTCMHCASYLPFFQFLADHT